MADYSCAFSRLESGKYFEGIIISFIRLCSIPFFTIHLGFSNPLRPFAIIHNNLFMRKCRVKMVKAQYHGTPFLRLIRPPYCLVIQLSLDIIQLSPEGEVNSGGMY